MKTKREDRENIRSKRLQVAISPEFEKELDKASKEMGVTKSSFAYIAMRDFMKKGYQ